jgi:hypothetical protein
MGIASIKQSVGFETKTKTSPMSIAMKRNAKEECLLYENGFENVTQAILSLLVPQHLRSYEGRIEKIQNILFG